MMKLNAASQVSVMIDTAGDPHGAFSGRTPYEVLGERVQ